MKSHQPDNRRHRRHHRGNEIRHAYYTTKKADRSGYNYDDDGDDDSNFIGGDDDDDDDDDDISNSIHPLPTMKDGKPGSNPHNLLPSSAHRRDSQVRNFNITVVSSGVEEHQEEDGGGMECYLFGWIYQLDFTYWFDEMNFMEWIVDGMPVKEWIESLK